MPIYIDKHVKGDAWLAALITQAALVVGIELRFRLSPFKRTFRWMVAYEGFCVNVCLYWYRCPNGYRDTSRALGSWNDCEETAELTDSQNGQQPQSDARAIYERQQFLRTGREEWLAPSSAGRNHSRFYVYDPFTLVLATHTTG